MDKYENRVVIFFDILGFRKWVNTEIEEKDDDCTSIVNIFRYIRNFYENYATGEYAKTVKISFFSDSIIISFEETDSDQIFRTVADLQILIFNLAIRKILVHGAINYGKLLHTDDFILGPAFMSAYDLETKQSVVPRIICNPDVIGEAFKFKNPPDFKADLPYVLDLFNVDIDEQLYIDYFDKIRSVFDNEKQYLNYILTLKQLIEDNLESSVDLNIRAKYLWMKEQFNRVFNKRYLNPPKDREKDILDILEKIT